MQVLLSRNTCSSSSQKASFYPVEDNLGGGKETGQNIILDHLPCRGLKDTLPEAFDVRKENALRVVDLDETGDRKSERMSSLAKNGHRFRVADGGERFEIMHGIAREPSSPRCRQHCGPPGEHI